jgi:hypothetical protein
MEAAIRNTNIPGATVAVLEDSRRAARLDQAGQFNQVVRQFLGAPPPSMPIESLAGSFVTIGCRRGIEKRLSCRRHDFQWVGHGFRSRPQ